MTWVREKDNKCFKEMGTTFSTDADRGATRLIISDPIGVLDSGIVSIQFGSHGRSRPSPIWSRHWGSGFRG
jgi:hypothetical protein